MNPGLSSLGAPPDPVAWSALVLALALGAIALGPAALRERMSSACARHPQWICGGFALAAAAVSTLWVIIYLRGGPRIIDATSYLLQAKGIAGGQFLWSPPGDLGSHTGRFLIGPAAMPALGVIFPPGYPALLSVGVLLGTPLAVGPALAAALVVATYLLARELFHDPRVALVAAALSLACAALRYHTADTMSHGAAALFTTIAVTGVVRGKRSFWIAGLAVGAVIATRPVTGLVVGILVVLCALRSGSARRQVVVSCVSALPGAALFLAHQWKTTGRWLSSSQQHYYARADGPPGCFRYGFGGDIGCRFEHGDFVASHLQDGYGLLEALGTTGRRLLWHALDVGNAEPIAYLALISLVWLWRDQRVRLLGFGILGLFVAYAPFYFDGSYPGGGARMFADILPLEHVLIAFGASRLRITRFVVPVALLGFAVRASYGHVALASRDGGRPMFEPARLAAAGVSKGLVFVDTDHGYNLGFDPRVPDADSGIVVARRRGDRFDWLTWDALGRPKAYQYRFDLRGKAEPSLQPWQGSAAPSRLVEGESLWPVRSVDAGHAHPGFTAKCASKGRGLVLEPGTEGHASVTLRLPTSGARGVRARWTRASTAPARAKLSWIGVMGAPAPDIDVISNICDKSAALAVAGRSNHALIRVEAWDEPVVLDAIELVPARKSVDN